MIQRGFLRECFRHNDWARDKLMATCADLPDAQLDRPFEMGESSLRATLYHLWAAEFGWLSRWQPRGSSAYDADCHGESVAEIGRRFRETAGERDAFLTALGDDGVSRTITVTNSKGITSTFSYGDMMLHVCNHGVHHRAQALNMLRHLGVALPQPGWDYIFMKLEDEAAPPPALDLGSIRAYYRYADWARQRVHGIAAGLSDEQLDRPFELGMGSLRATLLHIRLGEQWWLENWKVGPGRLFPKIDERMPIAELTRLFDQTRAEREAFLAGLTDGDLPRPTTATPRPGVYRTFPLGVTMVQLCCHGTHHRAQVLNMLRHVGAEVPALDYVAMLREPAS